MSINLNYVVWENGLKLTRSKKKAVVCEALFYLKCTYLEIFLSLFRLQCKDYRCLVIYHSAPTGRGALHYETKTAARETNLGHAQV